MKQVEIYGYLNESTAEPFATKFVATQKEGYIAIEQLKKLGCRNIVADFDELETLPKDYEDIYYPSVDMTLDDIRFLDDLLNRYANYLIEQNDKFESTGLDLQSVVDMNYDLIIKSTSIIAKLHKLYENK